MNCYARSLIVGAVFASLNVAAMEPRIPLVLNAIRDNPIVFVGYIESASQVRRESHSVKAKAIVHIVECLKGCGKGNVLTLLYEPHTPRENDLGLPLVLGSIYLFAVADCDNGVCKINSREGGDAVFEVLVGGVDVLRRGEKVAFRYVHAATVQTEILFMSKVREAARRKRP